MSTQPEGRRSVSIVVACRNESKHVRAFLNSVEALDLKAFDWQMIIADGMSNDGTRAVLTEFATGHPQVTVLDNPSRIVSTGLNAAIRASRGEFILRMDVHTEYASDYVNKCVSIQEATGAHNVGGPARTKADGLLARSIQAAYHSPFSTGGARFHDDGFTGYVDTVPYGCWRRKTIESLGLFDEHLVRNQDDELNLRLTRAGGTIWQSSEIVAWYRPRATFRSLSRQYFQYGFWKVPVIRKHKLPASWRHLVPGGFTAFVLALLFFLLIGSALGYSTGVRWALFWGACFALLYGLGCLGAACLSARRFGWQLLPLLPVTFAVFHLSYGTGFLAGLCYWSVAPSKAMPVGTWFEGLSR